MSDRGCLRAKICQDAAARAPRRGTQCPPPDSSNNEKPRTVTDHLLSQSVSSNRRLESLYLQRIMWLHTAGWGCTVNIKRTPIAYWNGHSSRNWSKPCMKLDILQRSRHPSRRIAIRWLILTADSSPSFRKACMKVVVILSTAFDIPERPVKPLPQEMPQAASRQIDIRWLILTEDSSRSFSKPCMKVVLILPMSSTCRPTSYLRKRCRKLHNNKSQSDG